MKTNCSCCHGFKNDKRAKATGFTLDDRVWHHAPDMWLAGRSHAIERESGLDPVDAFFEACRQFAFGCELEARYESQRAASIATNACNADSDTSLPLGA